jgi:hypothetical protein
VGRDVAGGRTGRALCAESTAGGVEAETGSGDRGATGPALSTGGTMPGGTAIESPTASENGANPRLL